MAGKLVNAMTAPWDPKNYRDTYTERVKELVKAKKQNREIVLPEDSEADDAKVIDLLAALQASLDTSKSHQPGNTRNVTKLRTRKADATATKKAAQEVGGEEVGGEEVGGEEVGGQEDDGQEDGGQEDGDQEERPRRPLASLPGARRPDRPPGGQSSGSSPKAFLASRYQPIDATGCFQRPFMSRCASSWEVSPALTASLRWRS